MTLHFQAFSKFGSGMSLKWLPNADQKDEEQSSADAGESKGAGGHEEKVETEIYEAEDLPERYADEEEEEGERSWKR